MLVWQLVNLDWTISGQSVDGLGAGGWRLWPGHRPASPRPAQPLKPNPTVASAKINEGTGVEHRRKETIPTTPMFYNVRFVTGFSFIILPQIPSVCYL